MLDKGAHFARLFLSETERANVMDKICDTCNHEITSEKVYYDARLPRGPWATLCQVCFDYFGCKLGTGSGQKYELTASGDWVKVEG